MRILLIMMATMFPMSGNVSIDMTCTKPVGFDYSIIPNNPKKRRKK